MHFYFNNIFVKVIFSYSNYCIVSFFFFFFFFFFIVPTIGFVNEPYIAEESDGAVTITVAVISGTVVEDLVVQLVTIDVPGQALG